ncbi:MAG TPA: sialidase family protein, partial [Polyangiaceae bacterium]|nr:sialidase family protein [Polyangiaceae bacterium]
LSFQSGWKNSDAGVAESKDGGVTWITHAPAGAWHAGMSVAFLKDSKSWLLGTQDIGYWRTADAGATWKKVSDTAIQHGGGTIYYAKTGILYASGSSRNMRSMDDGLTWTSIGTNAGYNAIFGDGTNLFTGACFGPAPMLASPESDGATWAPIGSQMFLQGPFEMAVDSANGILYNASWQAGMWALKLPK